MKIKNTIFIFLFTWIAVLSCKKDIKQTVPIIAPQKFGDTLYNPIGAFAFSGFAGGSNSIANSIYYYKPAVVKLIAKSALASSYEWYLRRTGVPDSFISSQANPVINFPNSLPFSSIVLVSKNNIQVDTFVNGFTVLNAPNALIIAGITIDTMPFINPVTLSSWNGSGGANVFCQIFDSTISTIIMDTMHGPGWVGMTAPTHSATYGIKYNLMPSNLVPSGYLIKYPTSVITYTISSAVPGVTLLDVFKVRLYNKNVNGTVDLIGEVNLIPSNFFSTSSTSVQYLYIHNSTLGIYIKLKVTWS